MASVFVDAATVVCLRESASGRSWEVLLGQNEVKNWLRSARDATVIMRYPGEWKFPGGSRDDSDTSLEATAIRELNEEFVGINAPPQSMVLHWVSTKETLAVKGKRFKMHNFVALANENAWLQDVHLVDRVNTRLAEKRAAFERSVADGSFWSLDEVAKETISPEVHAVQWFPIHEAIAMMTPGRLAHVNAFQEREFAQYEITSRDPMFQSMKTLEHVAALSHQEIQQVHSKV